MEMEARGGKIGHLEGYFGFQNWRTLTKSYGARNRVWWWRDI